MGWRCFYDLKSLLIIAESIFSHGGDVDCRTRVIVLTLGGVCESSTFPDCHKNQINKDFGLIIFGLDQVFVQDKTKIMLGLNVKSYFWPIRLSLPTV